MYHQIFLDQNHIILTNIGTIFAIFIFNFWIDGHFKFSFIMVLVIIHTKKTKITLLLFFLNI